ncbi:MAG: hypothetical protein ABR981_00200 [Candidatus Micrarchaeaceae archaeon]|jgi:LPS sulfotransferase NodH
MEVRTPTIDKYCRKQIKAVEKAYQELEESRNAWKEAYQLQDIEKLDSLYKNLDKAIRNMGKTSHNADTFLKEIYSIWKV